MQLKTNWRLVSVSFSLPKNYTLTLVSLPRLSQFAEWPCSWDIKDVCLLLESHVEVETLISGFLFYLSKGSLHSKALSHRSRSWLHADHQYANWISWNWKVDSWHSETTQSEDCAWADDRPYNLLLHAAFTNPFWKPWETWGLLVIACLFSLLGSFQ